MTTLPFPIEIGKQLSPEIRQPHILSRAFYFKAFLNNITESWANLAKEYLTAIYEENMDFLDKNVEASLNEKIRNCYKSMQAVNLCFDLVEPANINCSAALVKDNIIQGAFIERELNYGEEDYFIKTRNKKVYYELNQKDLKLKNISKVKILDCFLTHQYIEKDRSKYKKNLFLIEIQTNMKLVVAKKGGGHLIYGDDNFDTYETHYMQIENRRDYFQTTPYVITDFDFVLGGNPHAKKL